MEGPKLDNRNTTLVDSVEESLIRFFKEQGLRPGSSIPNEAELAASLGVGRPVLRESASATTSSATSPTPTSPSWKRSSR